MRVLTSVLYNRGDVRIQVDYHHLDDAYFVYVRVGEHTAGSSMMVGDYVPALQAASKQAITAGGTFSKDIAELSEYILSERTSYDK